MKFYSQIEPVHLFGADEPNKVPYNDIPLQPLQVQINHSVLRVVLTPKISNLIQTPIFRSGWVVGITPYAHFCPIPSPLLSIFSKNDFEV